MPCSLFHCTGLLAHRLVLNIRSRVTVLTVCPVSFFFCIAAKEVAVVAKSVRHYVLRFRSLWIMLICCHFVQHGRMRAVISVSSCCCVFRGESAVTAMHVAHTHTITNKLLRHLSLTFLIDKLKQSLLLSLTFLTLLSSVFVCV